MTDPTAHPAGDAPRVRRATAADAAQLALLRLALLEETGGALPPAERDAMRRLNEAFFAAPHGHDGWDHFLAEDPRDGAAVAVGSLAYFHRPPYPGNPEGRDAYFLNMYTRPAQRGRGAARAVLAAALAAARARGVRKVVLHATADGRPLYAQAGFAASPAYMELLLDGD